MIKSILYISVLLLSNMLFAQAPYLTNSGNKTNQCSNSTIWVSAYWDNGYGYGAYQNGYGGWSTSGTGTWNPIGNQWSPALNKLQSDAGYVPSALDVSNGSVTITFTVQYNGNYKSTNLTLSFAPKPTVNAGNDTSISYCLGEDSLSLSGSVSNVSGSYWSANYNTVDFSNASQLNTTYFPDSVALANGEQIIELIGYNSCGNFKDTLLLTINKPVLSTESNISVCAENDSITITSSIDYISDFAWRSLGTGTFSDSLVSNTKYYPSASDISSGNTKLLVYSTLYGDCGGYSDTLEIDFYAYELGEVSKELSSGETFTFLGNTYSDEGIYYDTLEIANSCDSVFTITVTEKTNTGIADKSKSKVKMYPNPADNDLYVELLEPENLRIYNFVGKLMLQSELNIKHCIDLSSFPKGLYWIKLENETLKFIKN